MASKKPKSRDLNTEILISIRDEIRSLRQELHSTRDDLNGRIDATNAGLQRLEVRTEAGFAAVASQLGQTNERLGAVEDAVQLLREEMHQLRETWTCSIGSSSIARSSGRCR